MIGLLLSLLVAAAPATGAAPAAPDPPAPPAATAAPASPAPPARPRDWKQEFEDICGKTQDAMELSDDDLKALVRRCDDLKPEVEKRPEAERKVTLKRLAACRNLFSYVLESRASR